MIWKSRGQRTLERFQKRFEENGDGYLFRPKPTSAPIKVSRAEFVEFSAAFQTFYRVATWGSPFLVLLLIGVITLYYVKLGREVPQSLIQIVAFGWIAVFMVAWFRAWRAPDRALANRAPAGASRSKDEVRVAHLRNLTWGNLALVAGIGAFLMLDALNGNFQTWAVVKGAAGLCLVALGFVQSWRKWQLSTKDTGAP